MDFEIIETISTDGILQLEIRQLVDPAIANATSEEDSQRVSPNEHLEPENRSDKADEVTIISQVDRDSYFLSTHQEHIISGVCHQNGQNGLKEGLGIVFAISEEEKFNIRSTKHRQMYKGRLLKSSRIDNEPKKSLQLDNKQRTTGFWLPLFIDFRMSIKSIFPFRISGDGEHHRCKLCSKTFRLKSQLSAHLLMHTGREVLNFLSVYFFQFKIDKWKLL